MSRDCSSSVDGISSRPPGVTSRNSNLIRNCNSRTWPDAVDATTVRERASVRTCNTTSAWLGLATSWALASCSRSSTASSERAGKPTSAMRENGSGGVWRKTKPQPPRLVRLPTAPSPARQATALRPAPASQRRRGSGGGSDWGLGMASNCGGGVGTVRLKAPR